MNHRAAVGGLWDEIGKLQFDFMVSQGLMPRHKLLDIGCGCLRGGVKFIEYLNNGNYHGIDKDSKLLQAGLKEVQAVGLGEKLYHLMPNGEFRFDKFETTFDFAIAQSVFTHLNLNEILVCLIRVEKVLAEDGVLYATFFNCQELADYDKPAAYSTSDEQIINTEAAFSRNIHYTFEMIQWAAWLANLDCEYIGGWGHPRKQEMVAFRK